MSRQVDLGQIVPNIQVGTTTTGSPSSQASVINIGTDLNPILNFTIPKGDPGAVHMIIVQALPTEDIDESAIYLLPLENPTEEGNNYAEYIYVNNQWELLGKIGVQVDLTDYVKNTDYASASKGGVIKVEYLFGTNIYNGFLIARPFTYEQYQSVDIGAIVGKATLENVITGKGLVSNTDYATDSVGGVIKSNYGNGFGVSNSGALFTHEKTYAQYTSGGNAMVIGKGTLENVITGKGLVSNTDYASSSTGGVIKVRTDFGTNITSGFLGGETKTINEYNSADNKMLIGKGTLENVLTAKIGDIQTLLDNLNTGNGV